MNKNVFCVSCNNVHVFHLVVAWDGVWYSGDGTAGVASGDPAKRGDQMGTVASGLGDGDDATSRVAARNTAGGGGALGNAAGSAASGPTEVDVGLTPQVVGRGLTAGLGSTGGGVAFGAADSAPGSRETSMPNRFKNSSTLSCNFLFKKKKKKRRRRRRRRRKEE